MGKESEDQIIGRFIEKFSELHSIDEEFEEAIEKFGGVDPVEQAKRIAMHESVDAGLFGAELQFGPGFIQRLIDKAVKTKKQDVLPWRLKPLKI